MPQATDEDRDRMTARFGSIGDDGPWEFLASRGYTINRGFMALPSPLHRVTEDERECIDFLCDEWDWAFMTTPPV